MNWVDYTVIGLIGVYALVGYMRGFVYSVFKIVSFFISIFISLKFYPVVSKFIVSVLHLDTTINTMISKNLQHTISTTGQTHGQTSQKIAETVLNSWGLPDQMQGFILKNFMNNAAQTAGNIAGNVAKSTANALSQSFTDAAINIISIVVVFIAVSIALLFARALLEGIAKLPIFAQINKGGGLIFGTLQGLLIIYIIFAIMTLFTSSLEARTIIKDIHTSQFARYFYDNNLLLIWAFGKR
jgi:uncharacterized membrane protein required for colicin V production